MACFPTMCVFKTDRVQEGIRELDILKDKRDVNLCATMALMFAHKKSHSVGQCVCGVCVCVCVCLCMCMFVCVTWGVGE